MAMRGERFELNLDPEDAYLGQQSQQNHVPEQTASVGFDFIKDVLEREPAAAKPPEPPRFKQSASGFPTHKKRDGTSRFKQRRAAAASTTPAGPGEKSSSSHDSSAQSKYLGSIANVSTDEKKSIDQQTTQMIANMSPGEMAEARQELLSESSVNIVRRLMKRATVEEPSSEMASRPPEPRPEADTPVEQHQALKSTVSFVEPAETGDRSTSTAGLPRTARFDEDAPPPVPPADLRAVNSSSNSDTTDLLAPKQASHPTKVAAAGSKPAPALDPSSASFLSDLHSTYFPDLPSDPSQLAWMAPVTDEQETEGQRSSTQIAPANLRFDFRGNIITKAQSAKIDVNKGLHHHGKDPGAAGYTINELSIYGRSTIAPQRCFAYQLLGRIMYRLGKGDFGAEDDPQVKSLYDEIRNGYILEQMLKEAAREPGSGNESARVWALEAVWLWRKGGGRGLDDIEVQEGDVMGETAGRILEEGLNPQW